MPRLLSLLFLSVGILPAQEDLYSQGRALMGKDTKRAIELLTRATEKDPSIPGAYLALAEIYASRNFLDNDRAVANLRAFHRLRPDDIKGYTLLNKIMDARESGEWAATLRKLLETRANPEDGRLWSALWAAEFRAIAEAEYPKARERVAADVRRLEPLVPAGGRDMGFAVYDGYKLSGQTDAAARMYRRLNPDEEFRKEYDVWVRKWNALTPDQLPEYTADYRKSAAEWVKRWPESPFAWSLHTMTLAGDPDASPEEVERAGLEALRLDSLRSQNQLRIAQYWLKKGVRPAECLRMAEKALAQFRLGPSPANDMTGARSEAGYGHDSGLWDSMIAIVDAAVQLKDFARANAMLKEMQQWLDDNRAKESDPTQGYNRFRGRYFHSAGVVEEAQGHKLEALSLYLATLAIPGFRFTGELEHARKLWDEAGGSAAAWTILTRVPPRPATKPSAPVVAAQTFASWTAFGKPLPDPNLRDLGGRTWTLADFRGKTTLLNVWATWCAPCWEELPQIQKLYETTRARRDVQVVTISVDENPGEVEPFLRSRGYTFPVLLLGRPYVEAFTGPLSVPRNWIVDPQGAVREQSIGFDSKLPDWPTAVLERMQAK